MGKRPEDQETGNGTSEDDSSDQEEQEVEEDRSGTARRDIKETHLFEVAFKNRVVNEYFPGRFKPIRGQQGRWYSEECLVVAFDERDAREVISKALKPRIVLGLSVARRMRLKREIKIRRIRRLG